MTNRTFLLLLLGFALSSPGHADEPPCAPELKQAVASAGTPGYEQASQAWKDCQRQADEQKKANYAATRNAWADGLDPLAEGGWTLQGVSRDGTYATFTSRRHETRKGSVVAVWLRFENRESTTSNGITFKSEVERDLYDCERITS